MNINKSIGDSVAAGAAMGLIVGLQNRHNRVIDDWQNYASDLQQQLDNTSRVIALQNRQLADQNRQLTQNQVLLAEEKEKLDCLGGRINYLTGQARQLKNDLQRQCGYTKIVHFLYERLIDEINEVSDPSNFASLDPKERLNTAKHQWEEFERTGEMVYEFILKTPIRPKYPTA